MSNITCSTITLKDSLSQPEISLMGNSIELKCVGGNFIVSDTTSTTFVENIELTNDVVITGVTEPPAAVEDDLMSLVVVDNMLTVEPGVYEATYTFSGKVEYIEQVPVTFVQTVKQTNYCSFVGTSFVNIVDATTFSTVTNTSDSMVAKGQVDDGVNTGVLTTYTAATQIVEFGYTVAGVISDLVNGRTLITKVVGTRSYNLKKLD